MLTANNAGNTLHGGDVGFGKYVWKVISAGADNTSLILGHDSPAGINGFPGNLHAYGALHRARKRPSSAVHGHHRRPDTDQPLLAPVLHAVGRSA